MIRKRPSPGESEGDILRQMEQFHKEQNVASKENMASPKQEATSSASSPSTISVLQETVVERPTAFVWKNPDSGKSQPQPALFTVDTKSDKPKGTSFFARQMKEIKPKSAPKGENVWGTESRLLRGTGLANAREVQAIHKENVDLLNSMTQEEIELLRQEVLGSLSRSSINFVRSKMSKSQGEVFEAMETDLSNQPELKDDGISSGSFSNCPHMDVVEKEKLAWTGDLKSLDDNISSGFSARFDFEGMLLPYSSDIPVTAGLHHHGEEEQRAGYTTEELITLARSTNVQQKALALTTLSKMVQNYKKGLFDDVFEQNLLTEMISGGLLVVARLSLDDAVDSVREAAIYCLRHLIDNQPDELALDFQYFTHSGFMQPSLPTSVLKDREMMEEFNSTQQEMKDVEVAQLDVVLVLLRMDILQRLAYVLNSLKPSPSATKNILCICIRIARHSRQSASNIAHHKPLMLEVMRLLEKDSRESDWLTVMKTLKLLRVLISWSRSLALAMDSTVHFSKHITRLLELRIGRAMLTLEVLRLWSALLQYGLLSGLYYDLHPLIIEFLLTLRKHVEALSRQDSEPEDMCDVEVARAIVRVVGCATPLIDCSPTLAPFELIESILLLVARGRFSDHRDKFWQSARLLLEPCMDTVNAIVSAYAKTKNDTTATIDFATRCFTCILCPFLQSDLMGFLLQQCESSSCIQSDQVDGRKRDPSNLPSLGAMVWKGKPVPMLELNNPFGILRATADLIQTLSSINKELDQEPIQTWLKQPRLKQYLDQVVTRGSISSLAGNWFSGEEINFLFHITLFRAQYKIFPLTTWNMANVLLKNVRIGQEKLAQKLFPNVVFNRQVVEGSLGNQSVEEDAKRLVLGNLLDIKDLYGKLLPNQGPLSSADTLTVNNSGEVLLPRDWIYLPLVQVSTSSVDGKASNLEESARKSSLVLQWAYISLLLVSPNSLPESAIALHYSRLLTTFLCPSAVFLNEEVQRFARLCLQQLLTWPGSRLNLDFTSLPGIESVSDFYREVLRQFEAESYGNTLFAIFVLLPTANSNRLRMLLWIDFRVTLRYIRIEASDLPATFGSGSFVDTGALDSDMITAYVQAIKSGEIRRDRNPLLFDIALRNIQSVCSETSGDLKREIELLQKTIEEMMLQ